MISLPKKKLTVDEITAFSSSYLHEGRKKEDWEIAHLEIEDNMLTARIRMHSYCTSPTDAGNFHLSMFSALEFLSQLTIIYGYVWAGYTKKTKEGWMVESSISSKQAIRDPENIQVRMEVVSIRKIKENALIVTQSRIFDEHGSFEARLKGFS